MFRSLRLGLRELNGHKKQLYSTQSNSMKACTIYDIHKKYTEKIPLSMCTAHDYITANWAQTANCDMILVGDSLAMTTLGYSSTTDLPIEEFKYHVKSVCRSNGSALVVVDMPFGSFESSIEYAISNAIDLMKISHKIASLKIEVGPHSKDSYTIGLVKHLCSRGFPIVGHIGLTPQKFHSLGGYKVQGNKTLQDAKEVCETAQMLQDAGCWALLLECVPYKISEHITSRLSIPTIGIGAGCGTSGQVLVISDLLGMKSGFLPKFVKQYTCLQEESIQALRKYNDDVRNGYFPNQKLHAFKIKDELWKALAEEENQNTA